MKVNEGLDGIDEALGHLVDLVEDEEGLRTLRHVAADPILKLELKN